MRDTKETGLCSGPAAPDAIPATAVWLTALRRYLLAIGLGNIAWAFAQLPLYTIWYVGKSPIHRRPATKSEPPMKQNQATSRTQPAKGRRAVVYVLIAAVLVVAAAAYLTTRMMPGGGKEAVTALATETHFHGIAVDAKDPSRLYLATHHGLFVVDAEGKASQIS
jgi:hypothetical protein